MADYATLIRPTWIIDGSGRVEMVDLTPDVQECRLAQGQAAFFIAESRQHVIRMPIMRYRPRYRRDVMTPNHLAKIKRTLLDLNRSPNGIKASVLVGLAQELGRAASIRGKEPTYVRDVTPPLPFPLSIPRHAADLRVGTAKNIIKSLLKDVAVWEVYLQGDDDEQR